MSTNGVGRHAPVGRACEAANKHNLRHVNQRSWETCLRFRRVRTAILTREFPPDVYGGAGVHVDYLVRELRKLIDVDVHAFGGDRDGATGHRPAPDLAEANFSLAT